MQYQRHSHFYSNPSIGRHRKAGMSERVSRAVGSVERSNISLIKRSALSMTVLFCVATIISRLWQRLRASRLALPTTTLLPSTTASLAWRNARRHIRTSMPHSTAWAMYLRITWSRSHMSHLSGTISVTFTPRSMARDIVSITLRGGMK